MEIKVSGILREKTSKNTGNTYVALDVNLTPTYVKTFFVDPADVEIVKQYLEIQSLQKNENK